VILGACIEALAGEDVHAILTTGHHSLPGDYLPLPDNFRFEAYLPGFSLARLLRKKVKEVLATPTYGESRGLIPESPPLACPAPAGGWKSAASLKTAYQHADPETILRVVLEGHELREAR